MISEDKIIKMRNDGDQDFITKEARKILREKKNGKVNRSNKSSNRGNRGKK